MHVIEYKLKFTYQIENYLLWFDNFECNDEWPLVKIKDIKVVLKSYKNKVISKESNADYKIGIYYKDRWIYLKDGKGEMIIDHKGPLNIPNLEITSTEYTNLLRVYRFDYDYHALLTVMQNIEGVVILESKNIKKDETKALYNNLKIEINGSNIIYRGYEDKKFEKMCKNIETSYKQQSKSILELYKYLDEPDKDPKLSHKALAYKTWYNAKRENQREWPLISNKEEKDSIEFPTNSGIYYYYPGKYIGLSKRIGLNNEIYIPRIFNKDNTKNPNSLLYKYINNIKNSKPKPIKQKKDEKVGFICQILDKDFNRVMVYRENKWEKSIGEKVNGVPALPYNYKMILHDYNKLNRLKKGKFMDLTHIGIVDENGKDEITYPENEIEYISKCLETRRTMSFKYIPDNKITILYDK